MKAISGIICLLLLSCGGNNLLNKESIKNLFGYNIEAKSKEHERYGASVIYNKQDIELRISESGDLHNYVSYETYIHYINKKGEKYTNIEYEFDANVWDIDEVTVQTLLPSGEVIDLDNKDIKKTEYTSSSNEARINVSFSFPQVKENCVLYYKIRRSGYKNRLPDYTWNIQDEIPVNQTVYKIFIPHILYNWGWIYNSFKQNIFIDDPTIKEYKGSGLRHELGAFYTYTKHNIPAVERVKYAQPISFRRQFVEFYSRNKKSDTWENTLLKDVGKSVDYSKSFHAGSNVQAFIKKYINHEEKNRTELLRSIYKSLKKINIKDEYIFQKSHIPKPANDTAGDFLENPDKHFNLLNINTLAVAILRELKYDANLAFVKNLASGPMYYFKVKLYEFDTSLVKVGIGSKKYWFNFTPEYFTMDDISSDHQGTNVAIVEEKLGKVSFETIDPLPRRKNKKHIKINAQINEDYELEGELNISLSGTSSHFIRKKLISQSKAEEETYIKALLSERIKDAELDSYTVSAYDEQKKEIELSIRFVKPDYIVKVGEHFILNPYVISDKTFLENINLSNRESALYFYFPWNEITTINITYPKKMSVLSNNMRINKSSRYIGYKMNIFNDAENNRIQINRIFDVKNQIIPLSGFDFLKVLSTDIKKYDDSKFELKKL